ncbi:TPA: tyrosine-type recombinase/integrase [Streptococcus pyogenes]|uniref:Site-specific integrase n=1 Tax=Streptococcus pyogenes TaxID=1314 RepID=A0A660A1Y2_STRPY|nr:site-specific integrase [Streptococcus pyogenes]EQL80396.1 site-specific recombinase, phage integrase family [Streptococcus pyogenes UTSW-2]ERL18249.1 site-specific recombinase, phage integrase family [Streptococcus pyogenes GA41046]ESA56276.1 site-specific recombinase, phage integrase family [Streptococcus pyogenes GA40377]QBX10790.1 integrase/recombinase [Streptococcus satellite phage Javan479]QBX10996.1 integrase/recombinase [Streptococcus satellite phage Javan519]HEP6188005.1 site-spec
MNIKEYKKKNGTIIYRTSVYLGVDQVTGKKARTTITASTKKGVKIKARDALNNFAMNGYTVKEKPTVTTYKELTALWWESYKNTIKPNSRQSMEGIVRLHILPAFGDCKLSKLTTPVIQQQVNKWANNANKGIKGAYANYSFLNNINRRILQYGVTMQVIEHNPARDVIIPRKQNNKEHKVKFFSNQELKQFLNYLDDLDLSSYENFFDYVLYKTLLATGCRIGEVLALEWSDIDLKKGTIKVSKTLNRYQETNTPKSKAGLRDIEIDRATVLLLKQYKNRQQVLSWDLGRSETIVFTPFTTKYAYACLLRKRLQKHFKAAGVPDISFHGFRHTHATIMLYAGIEAKDLQYRLGHSNISMTLNTYVHATKEGAKKAVSIFETAISNL